MTTKHPKAMTTKHPKAMTTKHPKAMTTKLPTAMAANARGSCPLRSRKVNTTFTFWLRSNTAKRE